MDIEKIKQWRPHDWKGHELKWKQTAEECYEEGADALLEALRKETGLEVDISAGIRVFSGGKPQLLVRGKDTPTSKGKLVFIPDEEKPDEH